MNSRDNYLELMGITRWGLRKKENSLEESATNQKTYYVYQLFDRGQLKAHLVAEAILKNAKEAELAEKIAQATKLTYQGGLVEALPSDSSAVKLIRLAYPPAEMLKDPRLKRVVWDQLKAALAL